MYSEHDFPLVLFFCWKSIGYFLLWSFSVLNRTPVHLVHEILLVDDFSDDRKWTWKPEGLRRRERGNCLGAHVLVHSLNLRETENVILEKRRFSLLLWFPIVPWHYNGLILFSILPLGVKCALSKFLTRTFWPLKDEKKQSNNIALLFVFPKRMIAVCWSSSPKWNACATVEEKVSIWGLSTQKEHKEEKKTKWKFYSLGKIRCNVCPKYSFTTGVHTFYTCNLLLMWSFLWMKM